MAVDYTKQPPALPADIVRVLPDGRPTQATIDLEQFQRGWYTSTVVDLDTRLTEVRQDLNDNSASFQEQIDAVVDDLHAEVTARESLESDYTTNKATVTDELGTLSDAQGAQAARIGTVETTVDGHTASISTLQTSVDGYALQYSITGTIDGTTGGLVIAGARTLDGSASFGIGFAASSYILVDPNLPSGHAPVFQYDTALGAFTFGVPVVITANLIAPGAIAGSKFFTMPAVPVEFASGYTIGTWTSGVIAGSSTTMQFDHDMTLDFEVSAIGSIVGAGSGAAVTIKISWELIETSSGTQVSSDYVISSYQSLSGPKQTSIRFSTRRRLPVTAGVNYTARMRWEYNSLASSGHAYLEEGIINYLAVIRNL